MRKMKKDLKKDLEIPEVVEQKIQNAYKEIGQGKVRMKKHLYAGTDKTAYGMIEDNSVNVQNPGAEAEDNGVTVTVSDAYCDGYEMYCIVR